MWYGAVCMHYKPFNFLQIPPTHQTLKWNFDTPRREFIEQLRSQMEASFSKSMLDQLFHADFKQHLKAIEALLKVVGVGCCGNFGGGKGEGG